jgi:hypothetical protein
MDSNTIPANMVALFQQFLASMANREEAKGTSRQETNVDTKEKTKPKKEELSKGHRRILGTGRSLRHHCE